MHGAKQGLKRFGAYVVLALSMLLMQQGGLRHAMQHGVGDDSLPAHSTLCKDCLSYCAGDVITPSRIALVLGTDLSAQQVASGQAQCHEAVVTGYLSRAPPLVPLT